LLAALFEIAQASRCRAGTMLFHEGQLGDGFYVVTAGRVNFTITSGANARGTGRQKLVGWVEKGSCLGLSELIADRPHTVNAVTALKTSVVFFPKNAVRSLLHHYPELWMRISLWLCADMQRAYLHKAAMLR
ncbi:MAG: Crp/Fnr family transcriptional regulator, partial [Candidatus Korobacteraceae bacterium]